MNRVLRNLTQLGVWSSMKRFNCTLSYPSRRKLIASNCFLLDFRILASPAELCCTAAIAGDWHRTSVELKIESHTCVWYECSRSSNAAFIVYAPSAMSIVCISRSYRTRKLVMISTFDSDVLCLYMRVKINLTHSEQQPLAMNSPLIIIYLHCKMESKKMRIHQNIYFTNLIDT